jgi:uncharacterized phiE125 gp8 family phage protein
VTGRAFIQEYDELLSGSPGTVALPLDLDTTKDMLRFTSSSEDDLIRGWIAAAEELFEALTGRQLIMASRVYGLDAFPTDPIIELPRAPLVSVESIVYDDGSGSEQTWDDENYTVIPSGLEPRAPRGRIVLPESGVWPSTSATKRAVRITYTAGYAEDHRDIPELIKAALYEMVRKFHAREDGLPVGTRMILDNLMYTAAQKVRPWRSTWV